MDIVEKAQALQNLVAVYRDLGDMKALDTMLASIRKDLEAEPVAVVATVATVRKPSKVGVKRGPYKIKGIYMALQAHGDEPITLEDLVPLVEEHQPVKGKTVKAKCDWLKEQMNKSQTVYREWPDGRWNLRKASSLKNGNGSAEDSAPAGK